MAISIEELVGLYRTMLTIRRFDERASLEFGRGSVPGLVHPYIGQKAIATGVCGEDPDTLPCLKSPPQRVTGLDIPIPYSPPIESYALPDREKIGATVKQVSAANSFIVDIQRAIS